MDFSKPFVVVGAGGNVTAVARIVSGEGGVGWEGWGRVGSGLFFFFFFFFFLCSVKFSLDGKDVGAQFSVISRLVV